MEKIIKETIFKKILNLAFEVSISSCEDCIHNYGAQHGHSCLSPFFYNLALEKSIDFDSFNEIAPDVKFHKGIPDIDELDTSEPNLIILDDLMKEWKFTRTLNLNSHYLILFNNPRDTLQIGTLARQMITNKLKFFMEAFEDAASKPHGYLLIDLKKSTEESNRIQTGITSDDLRIIYTSKD
ncbi:unnamed protein product [Brachionus calyciflorus]|uniref:Uncharacterized protein n=1 Tax=Brachionus calyciflorus TaxID=104777 RepID=A0A814PSM8_9BILA|nr:unnamed protein product [Brachionus calyciflorus]